MKQYVNLAIILTAIAMILVSCLSPYSGDEEGLPEKEAPITESDLFVPIDSTNEIRFYTNDPKYRYPSGCTLWTYSSDAEIFMERAVTVRKPLGSNLAGYGLIICSGQREVKGQTETVFLTVMINNNKQYAIGKVISGYYEGLVHWTEASGLINGIGLSNEIRIKKDEENSNKYYLFFNNVSAGSFTDEEMPRCEGYGRSGYVVVIAQDDLNNSAVEVRFKEQP